MTIHHGYFSIRNKLFIGFGLIILMILLSVSFVLFKITKTEYLTQKTVNVDLPIYNAYLNLNMKLYHSIATLNNSLLTHDNKFNNELNLTWQHIEKIIQQLDHYTQLQTDLPQNSWLIIRPLLTDLKNSEYKLLNSKDLSSEMINQTLTIELLPLTNKIFDILDGMITTTGERHGGVFDIQYNKLNNGAKNIVTHIDNIRLLEYFLIPVLIVFSLFIAAITAKIILKSINYAISIANNIAGGKRNNKIVITSNDETAELLESLNIMQTAIKTNEEKIKETEAQTRQLFNNIVSTAMAYSEHSSKVAAGDLTQRITVSDNNEMNQLGHDLNSMTESLANITKQITNACHNMVSMLTEVKHAIDTQSTGATEQASSINQITASLEEIEKSSTQTIDKAKQLGEVAERTRKKGELGLEAVEQSVNGMKTVRNKVQDIAQTILDLSNQTQQVGEITSVVNTLAQQSKMLALNASIEAAKAGEAGKGFAVVATEVKNLAEQSEQSTSQVQKILEDIRHATEKAVMVTEEGTKGVDHGMQLVEQNGDVIRSLIDVIHEATIASKQIEAAIRQEGIGIEQITAGMNEINQVSSSSIASVKQTTEAIENLSDITNDLKEQIDLYKV